MPTATIFRMRKYSEFAQSLLRQCQHQTGIKPLQPGNKGVLAIVGQLLHPVDHVAAGPKNHNIKGNACGYGAIFDYCSSLTRLSRPARTLVFP